MSDAPQTARAEPLLIQLGNVCIEVDDEHVATYLPDGNTIHGVPHDTAEYADIAREYGYRDDVARLNRVHETTHALVAWLLGLDCSPTFLRLSQGLLEPTDDTWAEEAAVMALERLANRLGVDLVARAAWVSEHCPQRLATDK